MNSFVSDRSRDLIVSRSFARKHVKLHKWAGSPNFVILRYVAEFRQISSQVKASVRYDYKTLINSRIAELNHFSEIGDWRGFYRVKHRMCPRKKFSPLSSISYNGEEFSSKTHIKRAFSLYFF